jgi:DNA-binding HxlR family transcriptional regulator
MPDFRYAQFCPLARATEILGERWTLLIVRELLVGPKRFSDLQRPLPGVSSSVLAERLGRLERRGVVSRRELPAPAAATVYALTEAGQALRPVVLELGRWGLRFLGAPRGDDHLEPGWVRLGLQICARRRPVARRRFTVAVDDGEREDVFQVVGGPDGTAVTDILAEPDASIRAEPLVVLATATGALDPREAVRSGALRAEGNLDALAEFPSLFELPTPHATGE